MASSKVFVGGVSPSGVNMIKSYMDRFAPDTDMEMLTSAGIKGKIKNHAKRPDVLIVVLDESLYRECSGVAGDILSLPKVHKYTSDDGLRQFLVSKFGELDDMLDDDDIGVGLIQEEEPERVVITEVDTSAIRELESKLAKSEMMVRNLTAQLEENKSDNDDDISALVQKVKELEGLLAQKEEEVKAAGNDSYVELGKVAKAEKVLEEFESLKAQIGSLTEERDVLNADLNRTREEVLNREKEIDSLLDNVSNNEEELTAIRGSYETLQGDLNTLQKENDSLKISLSEKDSESEQLRVVLTSKASELETLKGEFETKTAELEKTLSDKETELLTAIGSIEEIKSNLSSYESKVTSLTNEVSEKDNELTRLKEEHDTTVEELTSATSELESLKSLLENTSEVDELKTKLATLESDISVKGAQINAMTEELSVKNSELSEIRETLNSLESSKSELEDELSSCREELNSSNQQDKEWVASLEETISTLEATVLSLEDDLKSKDSEITLLKENDKSGELTLLQEEFEKCKAQDTSEAYETLKAEFEEYKSRYLDLELENASKENRLQAMNSDIFTKLATNSSARSAYTVSLDKINCADRNMICVAGGSNESCNLLYSTLANSMGNDTSRKFLFIDLMDDSTVDFFGLRGSVDSPLGWLDKDEPFTKFITDTKSHNVRVITTAGRFLNNLHLLRVDWNKKLKEIRERFKEVTIVVNVGSLSNIVSRVLFNTFSVVMKTHVILKSTPANLRTMVLTMTGFKSVSGNVVVDCFNFDEASSKDTYKKLGDRCKTQIITGTDKFLL